MKQEKKRKKQKKKDKKLLTYCGYTAKSYTNCKQVYFFKILFL